MRGGEAFFQVWIWIASTVILVVGVGLVHTGHATGDPIAAIGSFMILADMLLFGWLVLRRDAIKADAPRYAIAAE
jgi:hypothetical protein